MIRERFREVDWNPDRRDRRKFGLILAVGFPIMGMSIFLILRLITGEWRPAVPVGIATCGAGLGLLLALFPAIARPFYIVWHTLICVIDLVVTTTLLSVFFLLIITPAGLVLRLLGRSPIEKSFDREAATYWREAEKVKDPRRYYRQF